MNVSIFMLWLVLLTTVYCKNAYKIPGRALDQSGQNAEKTTIVGYNKADMSERDIAREKKRLSTECQCQVQNLASVGAFILTYQNSSHPRAKNLNLNLSKEIGVDDEVFTIFEPIPPKDPFFHKQWSLAELSNNADINAIEGWKEYLSFTEGGSRVIVAVIDTGIDYNHPDLKDVMWYNPGEIPGNGIDDDGNGIIDDVHGADFSQRTTGTGNPIDRHSHGTHCAGIIAAKQNNAKGIAGVASYTQGKVKLMAVKGLSDRGRGTLSGLLASLNYAINKGAKISSNSWGGGRISSSVEHLWDNVLRNNPDHLFVAAAGNDRQLIDDRNKRMTCGLKEPNLICVASSTQQDTKSSFSNFGKQYVHVFAPGSIIHSTIPRNRYGSKTGTSMACPHVSGLAALVRSLCSRFDGQKVREVIEANVQKKIGYVNLVSSGGIIDVAKTIRALKGCNDEVERKVDITCSCWRYRYATCTVGSHITSITLKKQHSRTTCRKGINFGSSECNVWVNHGCRATFIASVNDNPCPKTSEMKCSSWGYRYAECNFGRSILDIDIKKQHSRTRCSKRGNFGFSGTKIWVNRGCRATFLVKYT